MKCYFFKEMCLFFRKKDIVLLGRPIGDTANNPFEILIALVISLCMGHLAAWAIWVTPLQIQMQLILHTVTHVNTSDI